MYITYICFSFLFAAASTPYHRIQVCNSGSGLVHLLLGSARPQEICRSDATKNAVCLLYFAPPCARRVAFYVDTNKRRR